MRLIKKLIFVVLILMLVALAGCNGKNDTEADAAKIEQLWDETLEPTRTLIPELIPNPYVIQPDNVVQLVEMLVLPHVIDDGDVAAVAWSPDGMQLVSGGDGNILYIWDAVTWEMTAKEVLTSKINSIAWSPDGTMLIIVGSNNTVEILDLSNRTDGIKELEINKAVSAAWSPDGTQIAWGGTLGAVHIWDITRNVEVLEISGHTSSINAITWSPDGTLLASGSVTEKRVSIWDTAGKEMVTELKGWYIYFYNGIQAGTNLLWAVAWSPEGMAWSPDSTKLAAGTTQEGVQIWDAASGEVVTEMGGYTGQVETLTWSLDGSLLAASNGDLIQIWDAATGAELAVLEGHLGDVNSIAWSPDGALLASASDDGSVRIWGLPRENAGLNN